MPLSTVFQIFKMYRCRFIGWKCTELLQETFEDYKEVIWSRDSDRKKNDQKKKEKNKQWYTKNTTQKSKYLATHPHYVNTICYVLRSMNCELGQFYYFGLFPYWVPHFPTYLSSSRLICAFQWQFIWKRLIHVLKMVAYMFWCFCVFFSYTSILYLY